MTFGHQVGVCEGFRHTPVNRLTARSHAFSRFDHALRRRMQGKAFGNGGEFFGKTLDVGSRQAGFDAFAPVLTLVFAPIHLGMPEAAQSCLLDMFAFVQRVAISLYITVCLRLGYDTFRNQFFDIQCARPRMLRYFFVHHRLGQCRVVAFVMAPFSEADHIDHNVFMEFLTVIQRGLDSETYAFRIVAVDVDNRSGNHFRHVGTMHRRACIAQVGCGKADLVVDNDVNRTAGGVASCFGQIERCLVDTQADECRIAVNQYGQHFVAAVLTVAALFGARRTFDYGIDDFQVGRVERQ